MVGDTGFEFRIGTSDEEIDRARTILSEHQAISDAIVNADAEQARKMMVAHITSAQRYLYENVTIDLHAHRQQSETGYRRVKDDEQPAHRGDGRCG